MIRLARRATIVCQGDSLTYGADATRSGTRPGLHGDRAPRSSAPYPEALQEELRARGWAEARVLNLGFNNDTAAEGLCRWERVPGGDLTVLLYGSNDVLRLFARGPWEDRLWLALTELVRLRRLEGQVLLLEVPPVRFPTYRARIRAANAIVREVGASEGAPVLDLAPALSAVGRRWVDGVHFTPEANRAVARAVADVLTWEG